MSTNDIATTFHQMNSMYRYQRHLYDATRKFYLVGRDRLIKKMEIGKGQTIAEIGCGTGRNLRILARQHPGARFFGLDASSEMLRSAQINIEKDGLENVTLKVGLADQFDYLETFGVVNPFDIIFFSYSISMIPPWRESIAKAIANLKPGGIIYIVDFYDQVDLPFWFQVILKKWLSQFHVQFWSDLIPHLYRLDSDGTAKVEIEEVAHRYAFIASLEVST